MKKQQNKTIKFGSKEFKKLQARWYSKLKAEGFQDIETDEMLLNVNSTRWARLKTQTRMADANAYYELATRFLYEYDFENDTGKITDIDKVIWMYHVEGLGVRPLADVLKKLKFKKKGYGTVAKVVKRLKQIMIERYVK